MTLKHLINILFNYVDSRIFVSTSDKSLSYQVYNRNNIEEVVCSSSFEKSLTTSLALLQVKVASN